jgi:enterochelin esterase-like enzyme
VVYLLHGFTDDDARWFGHVKHWINLPEVLDRALANPEVKEMIVVMPNAFTRFQGSMYSNSAATGDWENYVARELVTYIDSHYRTVAKAASRGLAGHSMGGYGTLRIAMRNPGIFSSIYALSPCCLAPSLDRAPSADRVAKAAAVRTDEDIAKTDFGTKAMLASAAAWSPNPSKPPFYFDLPVENGEFQPMVAARWAANAPLALVDQSLPNLRGLAAIAFDAGTKDVGIAATVKTLDGLLSNYKIAHAAELYEGNHIDHIAERIETKAMPFFSRMLGR